MSYDVNITNSNGFFSFSLWSQSAEEWAEENIDSYVPGSMVFYSDDIKYARDIADAMAEAGMEVE